MIGCLGYAGQKPGRVPGSGFGSLGLFSDDEEPGGGTDSRGGGQRRGDDKSRVGPAGLEMPV